MVQEMCKGFFCLYIKLERYIVFNLEKHFSYPVHLSFAFILTSLITLPKVLKLTVNNGFQIIHTIRPTLMTDERLTKKSTEILRAGLFSAFRFDTFYFTILHSMCSSRVQNKTVRIHNA